MTTYFFSVLRLVPNNLRDEIINVGVALLRPNEPKPQIITMAPLNKLRAMDEKWNTKRLVQWKENLEEIVSNCKDQQTALQEMAAFGFCSAEPTGFFMANDEKQVQTELRRLRQTYVTTTKEKSDKTQTQSARNKLHAAIKSQFERMHVLGQTKEDLLSHLVVPRVPVPKYPELKSDFLYKNGVYRITQTIDYKVTPEYVPNKLQEVCVKATAARLAMDEYGSDTVKLAVVDVPDECAAAADNQIDMLLNSGFMVYKFGDATQMGEYIKNAVQ